MESSLESYDIHILEPEEKIESFDCGDADLNDFILNNAQLYQKELLATTYVVQDYDTCRTLAFFSLATDKVSMSEFESKTEFNRFRKQKFSNEKRLKSYPAVKLCRIGVDISARGLHLGSRLIDLIKMMCIEDIKVGCRFLTVDAYVNRISFYKNNGFNEMTEADKNDEHTRVLIYDLKKVIDI